MALRDFIQKHIQTPKTPEIPVEEERIFLTSTSDGAWYANVVFGNNVSGAFLTAEGPYPVELYYRRTDINGSSMLEMDTCSTRAELLESLNWIGKCGYSICELWDFNEDKPLNKDLAEVFAASNVRRANQLQKAADEMDEDFSRGSHKLLEDLIRDADAANSTMGKGANSISKKVAPER